MLPESLQRVYNSNPVVLVLAASIAMVASVLVIFPKLRRWITWHLMSMYHQLVFYYNYALFILYMQFVLGIGMTLIGLARPLNPANCKFVRVFVTFIRHFLSFTVEYRGKENILTDDCFILLSNHQSLFDVMFLSDVWPDRCVPLMKRSILFKTGLFGPMAWLNAGIFINRRDRASAIETCNDTVHTMQTRKQRVVIFPESTRNMGEKLLPFKKGAFHIAKQGGFRLMPVVVSSLRPVVKYESRELVPGRVVVTVLPPITPEEDKSVEELLAQAYDAMNRTFVQTNTELIIGESRMKKDD